MKRVIDNIELYAVFFMLLPLCLLLGCGVMWVFGMTILPILFPVCCVVAYFISLCLSKRKQQMASVVTIVGILLVTLLLSYLIHDSAYDSNWYHQQSIAALTEGWNPIYQHHYDPMGDNQKYMWVDHYAKGQETICATIVSTFGNMETGKMGNFFLPLSGFFFCMLAIRKKFSAWSGKKVFLAAVIIAFPPVIWNQLFTYYIDFVLYPIVIIALCSVLLYKNDRLQFGVVMASMVAISISVKFNLFMWTGLLYAGIFVYMLAKKNYALTRTTIAIGVVVSVVSLFSFAFNPYITNVIHHHTPFYPLLGGGNEIDIMSHVEPGAFKGLSATEKIVAADLSRPMTQTQATELQCPYGGYKLGNISACGSVDVKLGGAGLFWIDALILSLFVFVISKSYRKREGITCIVISVLFITTQFVVPGGWFYRYVSYIYLIPILLLFASEEQIKKRWLNWIKRCAYVLLLLNSIVGMTASASAAIVCNQIEDYYIKCINASDKPCYQSGMFGFVRKIKPEKRYLNIENEEIERIPILPTRKAIGIKYENLNREVETTFIQDLLLKKGVLK